MKPLSFLISLGLACLFLSCSPEAKQIVYGQDQCNFCKMNIVDKAHSSQYVTKKGKQFKFDAIECMVNDLNAKDQSTVAITLVSDFLNPGQMVDAIGANFLISKAIKSPMGANLSAFSSVEESEKMKQEKTGETFTWDQLLEKLRR